MAEPTHESHDQPSVEVSALGGTLRMFGGNALFFFLLLTIGLNIGVSLYEHVQRHLEHDQIQCSTKLAIYIFTTPRDPTTGTVEMNWERLPVDLYGCLPTFLYKNTR